MKSTLEISSFFNGGCYLREVNHLFLGEKMIKLPHLIGIFVMSWDISVIEFL
jgi:hypothetical protein